MKRGRGGRGDTSVKYPRDKFLSGDDKIHRSNQPEIFVHSSFD